MKIDPAISSHSLFGRGESLSGGSEGATWEEVRRERQRVWSREPGGGRERKSGAEEKERAIPGPQTANVNAR